jgi:hypothetical protein
MCDKYTTNIKKRTFTIKFKKFLSLKMLYVLRYKLLLIYIKTNKKYKQMKKILTTTALASALLVTANASFAQTTITGQLDIGYQTLSGQGSGATGGESSYRTFTRETQINIANKGKMSNGIDYAAGFSWEVDGGETPAGDGAFSENVYLDFIMGNTTLTISADHIQNPNFEITNLAGGVTDIDDAVQGVNASTTNRSLAAIHSTNNGLSASQAHGVGIIQNLGFANASIYYAPDRTTGGAAHNDAGANTSRDIGNSQLELMVRGDMGVKGLNAFVYRGIADSDTPGTTTATKDLTGTKFGASYNLGKISAAASQSKVQSSTGIDAKTTSLGLAYAVNNAVTIGLIQSKTDADALTATATEKVSVPDEKLRAINIGYNLGPVVVNAMAVKGDNVGGINGNDTDALHLNFTTKF